MADRLALSRRAADALRAEAERALPAECCGVLAGAEGLVTEVLPVANAADDARARYEMDPAELWAARRAARERGLDVVGFYHSHPTTEPVPSARDVSRAYYPDAVYAIVGLAPAFAVRAFRIANGRADEIVLDLEPPE